MKRTQDRRPVSRQRFGVGFWIGLMMLVLVSLMGLIGGIGTMVGFASAFLALTLLWHAIVGRSWFSPLLPMRRKQALIGVPISLVVLVAGFASAPIPTPMGVPATDQTSTTSSSPTGPTPTTGTTEPPTSSASATPTPSPTPSETPSPTPSAATTPPGSATTGSNALTLLAAIPIKGRAQMTGYDRAQFGQVWYDLDRNGCDTRNDTLRRDLIKVTLKDGTNGCVVLTGTLNDPYTATSSPFVRAQGASTIQIDHVVALGDAWQKGAQQLSAEQRLSLANDPLNLLAVDGPTNQSKGDGDAATWLPPNKSFRCTYVARQTAVKAKYALWMTEAEHEAVARILADCPNEATPNSTRRPLVAITPSATPTSSTQKPVSPTSSAPKPVAPKPVVPKPVVPKPTVKATTRAPKPAPTTTPPKTDVYYANCSEARAAGAAPISAGQPGYRAGLDRDHDGVACE